MKALKTLFALLLLASFGLLLSGCKTMDGGADTSVPWSRPQEWEKKAPGMGM